MGVCCSVISGVVLGNVRGPPLASSRVVAMVSSLDTLASPSRFSVESVSLYQVTDVYGTPGIV